MYLERNADVISGKQDLEHLHTFQNFPVFMGCTTSDRSTDVMADMSYWISRGSGMIQLNPLLPLEVLYPEAHGAGLVGRLWSMHHQRFAEFIGRFRPSSVLEIGGSHGILASNYQQSVAPIPWTIVEPNPTPIEGCKARFIKGFFDEHFSLTESVDAVVHSHVFEHIYEPTNFMSHLAGFMEPGKKLIFSVPNMKVMLDRKYTNCLNFEHTIFITEDYIDFLLAQYGFKVLARDHFLDDHSVFYACERDNASSPVSLDSHLYASNRALYEAYISHHESLISDINERIATTASPVYLFGAHVFSQYLLAFGLRTEKIIGLLDNDGNKQGKRLYGSHLNVFSPKVLAGLSAPAVILKAGVYNDEIKTDILENINPTTQFFE